MFSCSLSTEYPEAAILRKARTRVLDPSMILALKSGKVSQPEVPASTTVVMPERGAKASGSWLEVPSVNPGLLPAYTCVCILIRPGETIRPLTSTTFLASVVGMPEASLNILPSFIATSNLASILFLASITRPPFNKRSIS